MDVDLNKPVDEMTNAELRQLIDKYEDKIDPAVLATAREVGLQ